jgi:hypothetical protein
LSSVTMGVKAMHYCVRYTMKELLWEPWHKSPCRGQNECSAEGNQGSPALDFSPEGGAVRNSQGIPVWFSDFLFSPISNIPPDMFLSPFCHLFFHTVAIKEEEIFST